jgi:hypothetical protein
MSDSTSFSRSSPDDGYPNELIAEAVMAAGIVHIDRVYGRDVLVQQLGRLARTAFDPNADMSTAPRVSDLDGLARREALRTNRPNVR